MGAQVRQAAAGDAVLGVQPKQVYLPASEAEAVEVMQASARDRLRLSFIGGATELELGRPPEALDAVVRTERMARVLDYAPADMVIAAEAGVTLAALNATAHEHRQQLALDAPLPERATIGGLVATGAFGPRRARFGAVRDLIIGVSLIRADGVLAKGGGKVVKNVAGFDTPKVACGSLGTLGLISSAIFRLHPLPEATATVLLDGISAQEVVALVGRIREAQLEPSSAVALRTGGSAFDVGLRFEGFGKGVVQQASRLLELAKASQSRIGVLDEKAAAAWWARHDAVRTAVGLRVRVTALPTRLPALDGQLARLLGALRGGAFAWYATLGIGFAAGEIADAPAACAALQAARAALVAEGGALVLEAAPPEVRSAIDPWGELPSAFKLMQRLKHNFDPERRLNPGRFIGGL
jgi:glycolate oxidase FAD binding subunit